MTAATAIRVPPCPPACVEDPPMGPGELVRWAWCSPAGGLTVALTVRGEERLVRFWTGPGSVMPESTDPGDLFDLRDLLDVAGLWLAGYLLPRLPEAEQPTLFDEVAG